MSSARYTLAPFKNSVYVIFDESELHRIRDVYYNDGLYTDVIKQFSNPGTNHKHIVLTKPGVASAHFLYFPIAARQSLGMSYMYMVNVVNRMAAHVTLLATKEAGYNPTVEPIMYMNLVARLAEQVLTTLSRNLGGHLTVCSAAAMDIESELNPGQLQWIDNITPRTLSDLARSHCMEYDNNQVYHNDGAWYATTYFY